MVVKVVWARYKRFNLLALLMLKVVKRSAFARSSVLMVSGLDRFVHWSRVNTFFFYHLFFFFIAASCPLPLSSASCIKVYLAAYLFARSLVNVSRCTTKCLSILYSTAIFFHLCLFERTHSSDVDCKRGVTVNLLPERERGRARSRKRQKEDSRVTWGEVKRTRECCPFVSREEAVDVTSWLKRREWMRHQLG